MALINCYECNKEISDRAKACPHCGAPIENEVVEIIEDIEPLSVETEILKPTLIEEKIIVLRDMPVIMDSDVAFLYGVETKEINQAVKNNPRKFPEGFIFEIDNEEFMNLRSKFLTTNLSKTRVLPKAFTEQGLYMLATILKGKKAEETTIDIVKTFTRMRQFSRTIKHVIQEPDKEKQKPLMKRAGELIGSILDNDLAITDTETSYELNLAMVKIKHAVKRSKNK